MNVVATCRVLLLLWLLIVLVHVVDAVVDLVVDKVGLVTAATNAAAVAIFGLEVVAGGSGLKDVQKQERCRKLDCVFCVPSKEPQKKEREERCLGCSAAAVLSPE